MTFTVQYADGGSEQLEDKPHGGGLQGDIFWPDATNTAAYYAPGKPKYAVKLYKDPKQFDFYADRAEKLITMFNPTAGDPYWKQFYAWPERRVVTPRPGFRLPWAADMERLDSYMYGLNRYWEDFTADERGWFIGRLAIAMKLAIAANRLSSMGLCYADFSQRNAMVDIYEGRMMLIDCDALIVPSAIKAEVEGTGYFRAPEIISRHVTPTIQSDRHSLAVLFYSWFLGPHPLNGDGPTYDLEDLDLDEVLRFGDKALYIEHPLDSTNRLKSQKLKADALGGEIADLFRRAFVDGLHAPTERPMPGQWAEAFSHAYDRLIPCANPQCDWRFFIADPQPALKCPRCETRVATVRSLPKLYIQTKDGRPDPNSFKTNVYEQHWVVGWQDRTLHDWHLTSTSPFHTNREPDRTPRAVFEYDSSRDTWYLTNLQSANMSFQQVDDADTNRWENWAPNTSLELHDSMRLKFGDGLNYNRALVKVVRI